MSTTHPLKGMGYRAKVLFVRVAEGDGCNLSPEDRAEGYVDYVYYDVYGLEDGGIEEIGGAMLMLRKELREQYGSLSESIPDVLELEYDSVHPYVILDKNTVCPT